MLELDPTNISVQFCNSGNYILFPFIIICFACLYHHWKTFFKLQHKVWKVQRTRYIIFPFNFSLWVWDVRHSINIWIMLGLPLDEIMEWNWTPRYEIYSRSFYNQLYHEEIELNINYIGVMIMLRRQTPCSRTWNKVWDDTWMLWMLILCFYFLLIEIIQINYSIVRLWTSKNLCDLWKFQNNQN